MEDRIQKLEEEVIAIKKLLNIGSEHIHDWYYYCNYNGTQPHEDYEKCLGCGIRKG